MWSFFPCFLLLLSTITTTHGFGFKSILKAASKAADSVTGGVSKIQQTLEAKTDKLAETLTNQKKDERIFGADNSKEVPSNAVTLLAEQQIELIAESFAPKKITEGDIYKPSLIKVMRSSQKRELLQDATYRWENGMVPFVVDNGLTSSAKKSIDDAIKDFDKYTCIHLYPKTNEIDFIEFTKGKGCWSSIGRQGGKQTVSVGLGCGYKGTLLHLIMHVLGFFHEHVRPDRDRYIKVNYDNVREGKKKNFDKYSADSASHFGLEYDYDSIMHLGPKSWSKNLVWSKTMEPRNKDQNAALMGQRSGLSKNDVKQLNLYCKASTIISTTTRSPSTTTATTTKRPNPMADPMVSLTTTKIPTTTKKPSTTTTSTTTKRPNPLADAVDFFTTTKAPTAIKKASTTAAATTTRRNELSNDDSVDTTTSSFSVAILPETTTTLEPPLAATSPAIPATKTTTTKTTTAKPTTTASTRKKNPNVLSDDDNTVEATPSATTANQNEKSSGDQTTESPVKTTQKSSAEKTTGKTVSEDLEEANPAIETTQNKTTKQLTTKPTPTTVTLEPTIKSNLKTPIVIEIAADAPITTPKPAQIIISDPNQATTGAPGATDPLKASRNNPTAKTTIATKAMTEAVTKVSTVTPETKKVNRPTTGLMIDSKDKPSVSTTPPRTTIKPKNIHIVSGDEPLLITVLKPTTKPPPPKQQMDPMHQLPTTTPTKKPTTTKNSNDPNRSLLLQEGILTVEANDTAVSIEIIPTTTTPTTTNPPTSKPPCSKPPCIPMCIQQPDYPCWPSDYLWTYNGLPSNCNCAPRTDVARTCRCNCVQIHGTDVNDGAWNNNYLCYKEKLKNPNLKWSTEGKIPGMKCVQFTDQKDQDSWSNNYLCMGKKVPYDLKWSENKNISNTTCLHINEPNDKDWSSNYLCQ